MPLIPQFLNGLATGVVERWNKSMLLRQMAPRRMSKTRTTTTTTTMPQRQDLSVRMMHRILTPPRRVERGCRLCGGKWIRLCTPTVVDKYTTTRMSAFLVLDPIQIPEQKAKPRDFTEEGRLHIVVCFVSSLLRSPSRHCHSIVVIVDRSPFCCN